MSINEDVWYSVEWTHDGADNHPVCWNQHGLTQSKALLLFYRLELWLRRGRKHGISTRIRSLSGMSDVHYNAVQCMKALLAELPAEFSTDDPETNPCHRDTFFVIKNRNVRAVHEALWELQEYLGMKD